MNSHLGTIRGTGHSDNNRGVLFVGDLDLRIRRVFQRIDGDRNIGGFRRIRGGHDFNRRIECQVARYIIAQIDREFIRFKVSVVDFANLAVGIDETHLEALAFERFALFIDIFIGFLNYNDRIQFAHLEFALFDNGAPVSRQGLFFFRLGLQWHPRRQVHLRRYVNGKFGFFRRILSRLDRIVKSGDFDPNLRALSRIEVIAFKVNHNLLIIFINFVKNWR